MARRSVPQPYFNGAFEMHNQYPRSQDAEDHILKPSILREGLAEKSLQPARQAEGMAAGVR